MNCSNASDGILQAVQNSMDAFESDFDVTLTKIRNAIAKEIEAGRFEKSDELTR